MFFTAVVTSCENELKEKASLHVSVVQNTNVAVQGDTIVVKKGSPITFLLNGDPDFITFFSGEAGKKYEYRHRTTIDAAEIASSKLTFSVWAQYGNSSTIPGVLSIYQSENFPGLQKNKFAEDSVLVENTAWQELIEQSQLPQAAGNAASAQLYEVDMLPYLGKRLTIAIKYKGVSNVAAQPRINFVGMKIVNRMKDGTTTTLNASNLGFTAVNMCHRLQLNDQKNMTTDRAYGTVTSNISGIWNLKDASHGNFFIHSSNANTALKYSWLVSDYVLVNACSPDAGTNISTIHQTLSSYEYTYTKKGVYTATFLGVNGNYEQESSAISEQIIKVID